MKMIKNAFSLPKCMLCIVLALCLIVGTFVVSGQNTSTYTFDFEEATSGAYNDSTAWGYDKNSDGIGTNTTSLLKFAPPKRQTFTTHFNMPEAEGGKYLLDFENEYEITFKYYSGGIGSGKIGDFMIRDEKTTLASVTLEIDKTKGTNGEWKTATVAFKAENENSALSLGLKVEGQYSKVLIYFDDFTVKATKTVQEDPDPTFLNTAEGIINFDGENKALNSTGIKYETASKRYVAGNSTTMLKFVAANAGTDYGVAFYNGMDTVPLTATKLYTIKFKYYNPSQNGTVNFTVGTSAENSAWTDYQIGDIVTLSNNTDGWVDGEASFTVTPKTETANYLFIRIKSDVMGNETYFDNFQIIEEPDMDIDIIDIDCEGKNAALTSAGWTWYDASAEAVGGNNTTLLRFNPGENKLTYYVTKLYKGKRTIPINDYANYSLSFEYYANAFEGTLGEFYIKNKSGENLFYSALDITAEKGTDGEWKKVNFVFTAKALEEDFLQIMYYTKDDNTNAVVYFDNFKLVRLDNIIESEKMLEAKSQLFNVTVSGSDEDFKGYANVNLQFKLDFTSTYGNKKVIEIAGVEYMVSDYGMVYRPSQFSALSTLAFDETEMADRLISSGYNTKVMKTEANSMEFSSEIINIRELYKDMDIDARPFIVITPMKDGTGTVYAYGSTVTLNVADVAATSQDSSVKQFVS